VIKAVYDISFKRILPLFALFAGIGYLINQFIPAAWISALFGSHNVFAIPIAALVGLPLYVNGIRRSRCCSRSCAAASAASHAGFQITGPGTSAGVLAGIATIMKRRPSRCTSRILLGAVAMLRVPAGPHLRGDVIGLLTLFSERLCTGAPRRRGCRRA
jgi:uncharacterized membrane protein YraQ (UPF0718 family)